MPATGAESSAGNADTVAKARIEDGIELWMRAYPRRWREARGQADRLERFGATFDARVAAAYAAVSTAAWQARHPECGLIVPVAAEGAVEAITARLLAAIVEHIRPGAVLTT